MSHATSKEPCEKSVNIIVNGRRRVVDDAPLCFEHLIDLAFEDPPSGPMICFTVTYRKGGGRRHEGTLTEGECVNPRNGMIFNVTATDKS